MTSEVSPLAEGHWELSPGPSRNGRTTNWACSAAKSLGKGPVRTSPSGERAKGLERRLSPLPVPSPCRPFYHLPPAGSGLAHIPLLEVRSGNRQGRAVIGPKRCLFFCWLEWRGIPEKLRGGGGEPSSSLRRPLPENQGYTRLDCVGSAPGAWKGADATRCATSPNPTWPRTIELTKAQALLLLFFFISLFHIHISHSMEKPERVRQRWYNRSAVTGAGRGGAERGQTGWLPTCIPLGH